MGLIYSNSFEWLLLSLPCSISINNRPTLYCLSVKKIYRYVIFEGQEYEGNISVKRIKFSATNYLYFIYEKIVMLRDGIVVAGVVIYFLKVKVVGIT